VAARAATSDANHLLYLVKANQLAAADPTKIKAPMLLIYSPTDLVFPAPLVEDAARKIAAAGDKVDTAQLAGPNGHLNGVVAMGQVGPRISAFLSQ
jgi:homoserine O-acetyltransferase/O-succinyltransferase